MDSFMPAMILHWELRIAASLADPGTADALR
jgi:hypothetical protein